MVVERYSQVSPEKAGGATYTPTVLADFVADQMIRASAAGGSNSVRVLDPAVGDAELLLSLLRRLSSFSPTRIEVYGFDTSQRAVEGAAKRLTDSFPTADLHLQFGDFLDFVLDRFGDETNGELFVDQVPAQFDLVIANPPYVRTQIIGSDMARRLARQFDLGGRVDLYHAFLVGISRVLSPHGIAGVIVSNRFMTTQAGRFVREAIRERFNICHIWDLGDTKIFNVAVLPAVLLLQNRRTGVAGDPRFTSIYEIAAPAQKRAAHPIQALSVDGVVEVDDGRRFYVQHGLLDGAETPGSVWRIKTQKGDAWLATVKAHSWGTFRDIGKVRVGVKTCADQVFIRSDWYDNGQDQPELLRPLTTHLVARRYRALEPARRHEILYPHEVVDGRRQAVDLSLYPRSRAYLERHRAILEARSYVIEARRKWYELWVPQDPAAWARPKLVFRDISEAPTFWIDREGTVVNGDCYWLICDPHQLGLLWLAAAVGNSRFIEEFYDHCFHNKLYAGRRRFITQYVERFPLPDPTLAVSKKIVAKATELYSCVGTSAADALATEINSLVWEAFGLSSEEPRG